MAVQGATQGLIAAFTFGTVVNAASAALFLYIKGHGTSLFRDSLRLALVTFLLSAALWAQIDFVAVLVSDASSTSSCGTAVIFAAVFDQLGRFAIEQYLVWAIGAGGRLSVGQAIPQLLILARFVAGAVFVGFTRGQTDTFCVPTSSSMPVAGTVIGLDVAILLLLTVRAFSTGMVRDIQNGKSDAARSKSVLLVIIGFALWTATSVTLELGMTSMDVVLRTAVPAAGLSVLIIIVTGTVGTLATPRSSPSSPPEAPSPRRIQITRDLSSADSADYPPSRFEDLKEAAIRSSTTFINPREAPRARQLPVEEVEVYRNENALPNIARPVTGVAGIGGLPVQGALFPPPREETAPVAAAAFVAPAVAGGMRNVGNQPPAKMKKSLFGSGRGGPAANIAVGKRTIGNPILQEDSANPLNKIATIDLSQAAEAEKQRRERMLRESDLIAKRPAPQPPTGSPEEALKQSTSFKRKEVASIASQPSIPPSSLMPEPSNATTSSAQLSPGVEEIRRRSPRLPEPTTQQQPRQQPAQAAPITQQPRQQVPQAALITRSQSERQPPAQPAEPKMLVARTSTFPVELQPKLDATIRPSRQRPPSPKTPPPEPTKTPLQRRPTTGLPSNPRSRGLKIATESEQTVLFVNNITYDDPAEVEKLIANAKNEMVKSAAIPTTPGTSGSVVHRPRPIPRRQADPPFQPTHGESKTHRRTKSGGSIVSRKSILLSNPGSPTVLPPLPKPPPKSAGLPARPQPNKTKSMTVDEKMTLMFPEPPSGKSTTRGEQDMPLVPQVPPLPATYLDMAASPTDSEFEDRSKSNRTTKTSVQTESIFDADEFRERLSEVRKSEGSSRNLTDDVGNSWLPPGVPMMPAVDESRDMSMNGGKRASSPVIPARSSAWTETSDGRTLDDATTNWSAASPEYGVGVQVARQAARTTNIAQKQPDAPTSTMDGRGSTMMTIMLDDGPKEKAAPAPIPNRTSWLADADETDTNTLSSSRRNSQSWHRRVGEDCPTFSDRKEKMRSRMPPPTPLLLSAKDGVAIAAAKKQMVMHNAEPSPLESPEHALQQIQAQLRKLEEPAAAGATDTPGQRAALLENLEREMGDQESVWKGMQHDLGRDSMSSIRTSPSRASRGESMTLGGPVTGSTVGGAVPGVMGTVANATTTTTTALSRESSTRSTIGSERRASRLAKLRASIVSSKSQEDLLAASGAAAPATTPEHARVSMWKQRLLDAQNEYDENATELLRKRSMNFLNFSAAQLGSPTPPDSDHEEEMPKLPPVVVAQIETKKLRVPSLWKPEPKPVQPAGPSLWRKVEKEEVETIKELPGLAVRPSSRVDAHPLTIESSHLWRKPYDGRHRGGAGLWRPSWASAAPPAEPVRSSAAARATGQQQLQQNQQQLQQQQQQQLQQQQEQSKPPRPVTVRPPRRNKRVTLLPDIIENPEPLPDKRGTLGIFQFPWGEKSDTASIQPRPSMYMAMPGTMSSGASSLAALDMRSRQLEAAEYSSSFFDDYDDDEDDNSDYGEGRGEEEDEDDEDGGESDDGFDETTLWEIASLLKTDGVPSKNSLFPPPLREDEVVDDYLEEINEMPEDYEGEEYDDDGDYSRQQSIMIGLAEEPMPEQLREVVRESQLWESQPAVQERGDHGKGLPHPDDGTWAQYGGDVRTARAKPRRAELGTIESSILWTTPEDRAEETEDAKMWTAKEKNTPVAMPEQQARAMELVRESQLWDSQSAAPQQKKGDHGKGLPHPEDATWESYGGGEQTARAKPRKAEAASIESSNLWMTPQDSEEDAKATASPMWAAKAKKSPSKMSQIPRPRAGFVGSAAKESKNKKSPAAANKAATTSGLWEHDNNAAESSSSSSDSDNMLFSVNTARTDYRTTAMEPAAKSMTRKSRSADTNDKPLDKLASAMMWNGNGKPNRRVRFAKMSHGMWGPSARANGADEEESAKDAGMFKVDRKRSVYRTTDKEPAAKKMERKARPVEDKPLSKLESVNLWSAESSARSSPTEQDWMSGGAKKSKGKIPLRKQWRRPVAYREDWEAALQEALVASYGPQQHGNAKLQRVNATMADWAAALDEALVLSALKPAFNPAVRHPVFAGSLAITCAEDAVHPAMAEYAAKKLHGEAAEKDLHHHERSGSTSSGSYFSDSGRSEDSLLPGQMMGYSAPTVEEEEAGPVAARSVEWQPLVVDNPEYVAPAAAEPVFQQQRQQQQQQYNEPVYEQPQQQPVFFAEDPALQAQIEALEQEKLFIAQAAQVEYEKRQSYIQMQEQEQEQDFVAPPPQPPLQYVPEPVFMPEQQYFIPEMRFQVEPQFAVPEEPQQEQQQDIPIMMTAVAEETASYDAENVFVQQQQIPQGAEENYWLARMGVTYGEAPAVYADPAPAVYAEPAPVAASPLWSKPASPLPPMDNVPEQPRAMWSPPPASPLPQIASSGEAPGSLVVSEEDAEAGEMRRRSRIRSMAQDGAVPNAGAFNFGFGDGGMWNGAGAAVAEGERNGERDWLDGGNEKGNANRSSGVVLRY